MGNPFEGNKPEATVEVDEAAVVEPDADLDVDAGTEDGPEDTPEAAPAKVSGTVKKVGETKAKTAKNPVAAGYIAPVAMAKKLSQHLTEKARAAGQIGADEEIEIAPQILYATLKNNGEGSKNPIPQYTDPAITGGLKSVVKEDEVLKWWDEKDARVASRKSNVKKSKPDATEEPAKAEDTTPPVEAE